MLAKQAAKKRYQVRSDYEFTSIFQISITLK